MPGDRVNGTPDRAALSAQTQHTIHTDHDRHSRDSAGVAESTRPRREPGKIAPPQPGRSLVYWALSCVFLFYTPCQAVLRADSFEVLRRRGCSQAGHQHPAFGRGTIRNGDVGRSDYHHAPQLQRPSPQASSFISRSTEIPRVRLEKHGYQKINAAYALWRHRLWRAGGQRHDRFAYSTLPEGRLRRAFQRFVDAGWCDDRYRDSHVDSTIPIRT
jgi:hypothetical protein